MLMSGSLNPFSMSRDGQNPLNPIMQLVYCILQSYQIFNSDNSHLIIFFEPELQFFYIVTEIGIYPKIQIGHTNSDHIAN